MEIELWNGSAKAIIDPQGAWLTNLSDDRGDVLFPKRRLKAVDGTVKDRGGCHVCLPNFGPGGDSGQPQHGFGRDMVWMASERFDDAVKLTLAAGRDGYADLSSVLTYKLDKGALTIALDIVNKGVSELRVAPAFHPYIAALGTDMATINGEVRYFDDLAGTLFESGDYQEVIVPNRRVILRSQQLPMWAQWTDQLGAYVCVEPTTGGYTFLNETPADEELLRAGEAKSYILTIQW